MISRCFVEIDSACGLVTLKAAKMTWLKDEAWAGPSGCACTPACGRAEAPCGAALSACLKACPSVVRPGLLARLNSAVPRCCRVYWRVYDSALCSRQRYIAGLPQSALWGGCTNLHGGWVVGVDVLDFFVGAAVFGGDGVGVDGVAEFFRGFEEGDAFGGDVDLGSGFGVAADAGVALPGAEAAEAADFDLVARFEGADDGLEERIYDDLAIAAGEIAESGDFIDQVSFRHQKVLSCESGGRARRR